MRRLSGWASCFIYTDDVSFLIKAAAAAAAARDCVVTLVMTKLSLCVLCRWNVGTTSQKSLRSWVTVQCCSRWVRQVCVQGEVSCLAWLAHVIWWWLVLLAVRSSSHFAAAATLCCYAICRCWRLAAWVVCLSAVMPVASCRHNPGIASRSSCSCFCYYTAVLLTPVWVPNCNELLTWHYVVFVCCIKWHHCSCDMLQWLSVTAVVGYMFCSVWRFHMHCWLLYGTSTELSILLLHREA